MIITSNPATISVVAQSRSLGQAAAALAPGQWGTWTIGNAGNADPGNVGDSLFSYCQTCQWDPVNRVAQFFGGSHGSLGGQHLWLDTYNDSTNTWSTPLALPGGNSNYEHTYYNHAVDPASGTLYWRTAFGSMDIMSFNQRTRTSSTVASNPNSANFSNPLAWHPNLAGGSLIWTGYWGIYRRASSSWISLGGSGLQADQNGVIAYNPKDDCVYFGGGDGSGGGQFRRINASGAISANLGSPPVNLGTWSASSGASAALLVGSGNPANKLVAISINGDIHEFDDVTNTWSGVIGQTHSDLRNAGPVYGASMVACRCPTYQCILFFKLASSSTISTTGYIWKR